MRRNIERNLPTFDVVSFTDASPSPVRRKVAFTIQEEQDIVSASVRVNEDIPVEDNAKISAPFVFDEGEPSNESDSASSVDDENTQKSTVYSKRQQNSAKNWENVRDEILKAAIESESIPVGQMCTNCRKDSASYRCLKCGIGNYFCESCIALLHSNKCVFHVVEQWKVSICNL